MVAFEGDRVSLLFIDSNHQCTERIAVELITLSLVARVIGMQTVHMREDEMHSCDMGTAQ